MEILLGAEFAIKCSKRINRKRRTANFFPFFPSTGHHFPRQPWDGMDPTGAPRSPSLPTDGCAGVAPAGCGSALCVHSVTMGTQGWRLEDGPSPEPTARLLGWAALLQKRFLWAKSIRSTSFCLLLWTNGCGLGRSCRGCDAGLMLHHISPVIPAASGCF